MPLKPSGRLPKRFNRRVTQGTRSLVGRRYERKSQHRRERLRRVLRRTQQNARRWQRAALRWGVALLLGLVLLFVGLLLFSPLLRLEEIKIRRLSPRLDIEQVQQVMSPLFGRHLLFLTTAEVRELLQANITDLRSVEIDKVYPSELTVTVELDPLVARLIILDPEQEEAPAAGTGGYMDFLTDEGVYVVAPGALASEELPAIRIVDWGVRPNPGTELLPLSLLERLFETEDALRAQFGHSIEIRTVYLRAQEYHLLANGISLWFDMRTSAEQHLQRYRMFLQSVRREDVQQYIDLRLTDRIVYK